MYFGGVFGLQGRVHRQDYGGRSIINFSFSDGEAVFFEEKVFLFSNFYV